MDIRKSTPGDLEQVRRWLQQEEDDGHDSFIVNFNMLEDGQKDGSLSVLIDDIPIAFALGDQNLAILAVKLDRRGNDVGRMLAEHWFAEARSRDLMGFYGECAPRTSLGFWKKMGCVEVEAPYSNSDVPWVAIPFRQRQELPVGVPTVRVSFEILLPSGAPSSQWSFNARAAVIDPCDLMLAEDFVAYVPKTDSRIIIQVDGSEIGNGKVRDIGEFGGTRRSPWIRVRDLAIPKLPDGSVPIFLGTGR